MTTTFLVAVDGSEGSRKAARFAAERARQEGARVVLVHVVDWSPYDVMTPDELAARHVEREEEIREARKRILEPLAAELRELGVEPELMVRHGHAAETICEVARELDATQVFAGRRGRSKLGALLFGSVSGSLVQICPVPLTVV